MRKFKCDQELTEILKSQGFIDTSSKNDIAKGKKEFRFKKNRKYVRFDYDNFLFFEGSSSCSCFGRASVPEEDLILLFWYLNASSTDKEEICSGSGFSVEIAKGNLKNFRTELEFYLSNKFKNRSISKLKRLVNTYDKVILT